MRCDFKADIKEDYKNYIKALSSQNWKNAVPKEIRNNEIGLGKYLEKKYKHELKFLEMAAEDFRKIWDERENLIFARIREITGKETKGNFTIFLTTIKFCPYDTTSNSIWIYYLYENEKFCTLLSHELLHFNFHQFFFEKIKKEIGEEKTQLLKESLTFLLNEEFNDILKCEDSGYPAH